MFARMQVNRVDAFDAATNVIVVSSFPSLRQGKITEAENLGLVFKLDPTTNTITFLATNTVSKVTNGTPILLGDVAPRNALYLGDMLDDALAARHARVPFVAVLPRGSDAHRVRAAQLRRHGARLTLHNVSELERYWK